MTRPHIESLPELYDPTLMPPGMAMGMGPYGAPMPREPESQSLWAVVDDRLKGRWIPAIILGLLFAAGAGLWGWRSTVPLFRSESAIQVSPRLPVTLAVLPEQEIPQYRSFMLAQAHLIRTERVLSRALDHEQLVRTDFARSPNALRAMEKGLEITADPGSQLIFVDYASDRPELAQAVVAAVIGSYMEIWGQENSGAIGERLSRLHEIEDQGRRELTGIREEIQRITRRYGTNDLDGLQSRNLEEIDAVRDTLSRVGLALQRMEGDDPTGSRLIDEPTIRQLEADDPQLRQLRQIRDDAQIRFDGVRARFRSGSGRFVQAQDHLEIAMQMYEDRLNEVLANWNGTMLNGFTDAAIPRLTPSQLHGEIAHLEEQLTELQTNQQQLLVDIGQLHDRRTAEERASHDLDRAKERREQLELEEPILRAGHVSVVQDATLPGEVYSDGRKKRAVMGVGLGFAVSFGVFFLWGSLDRRAFGTGQIGGSGAAATGDVPCLGVLPDLKRKSSDLESTDVASHCVHQIRNQIEVRREQIDGYVIAVTSPHQGDGKTSVVMSLGWSYAAAGYETLLVDCDLVGRSLSRQLGMVGREGLKEALLDQMLNGQVVSLPVPHLSALPAGVDPQVGPETVRRRDLETILDSLRGQYDVIIIDTGPMLGSLESTPVTAAANGVVLLVRRGRSRSRLEECTKRLASIGATCLGVILNCAVRSDCDRYVSEASIAAADEVDRAALEGRRKSVVQAADGEGNALMLAMESRTRTGRADHEGYRDDSSA